MIDAEHVFEAVVGGGGLADHAAGVEEEDVEFQVRIGGEEGGDGGVDEGDGGGIVRDAFEGGWFLCSPRYRAYLIATKL